jgi:dienelactone hydrolase
MQAQRTDTFRESIVSVLGAPPDPAPMHPEVLDVVAGKDFRREHIKFQVSPGDWSYAYLLVPDHVGAPAPVVYCHHRRTVDYKIGKAEIVGLGGDKEQAIGLELVRRGYVVFAPDALGFGERRPPESDGDQFDLAYNYHQLALRLLRGETLLRKVLWDVSRGIDYLETRAEIDSRFIGFIGHGYGAKMALWATAMESRIHAAVAHRGVITYREHIKSGEWFQPEFVVPRLMQVADVHHLLNLIAPRPFLISTTEGDSQSADAADIYQKAITIYEKQGAANRVALYSYKGNDTFARHMRYNAYHWLDSWLKPF